MLYLDIALLDGFFSLDIDFFAAFFSLDLDFFADFVSLSDSNNDTDDSDFWSSFFLKT